MAQKGEAWKGSLTPVPWALWGALEHPAPLGWKESRSKLVPGKTSAGFRECFRESPEWSERQKWKGTSGKLDNE
jgi:hypothetical protein